jgi:hypothetical protein
MSEELKVVSLIFTSQLPSLALITLSLPLLPPPPLLRSAAAVMKENGQDRGQWGSGPGAAHPVHIHNDAAERRFGHFRAFVRLSPANTCDLYLQQPPARQKVTVGWASCHARCTHPIEFARGGTICVDIHCDFPSFLCRRCRRAAR